MSVHWPNLRSYRSGVSKLLVIKWCRVIFFEKAPQILDVAPYLVMCYQVFVYVCVDFVKLQFAANLKQ